MLLGVLSLFSVMDAQGAGSHTALAIHALLFDVIVVAITIMLIVVSCLFYIIDKFSYENTSIHLGRRIIKALATVCSYTCRT